MLQRAFDHVRCSLRDLNAETLSIKPILQVRYPTFFYHLLYFFIDYNVAYQLSLRT